MSGLVVAAMPGEEKPASRFAALAGATYTEITVRAFPDGESLVTVPRAGDEAAIYCSLDRPDAKFLPLAFAASAFRDQGVKRLFLIAPYLAYMRQDTAFHEGEAVSQKVFGGLLSSLFEQILTLEPHLHRAPSLDHVFGPGKALAVSAAPLLGEMIASATDRQAPLLIVGPDEESAPWTRLVADVVKAPWLVMAKKRKSGREVEITLDAGDKIAGSRACLVDDIASSGATLAEAARILRAHGAAGVDAFIVHALMRAEDLQNVKKAGVERVMSTDSIRHETNAIEIAPLLAQYFQKMRGR